MLRTYKGGQEMFIVDSGKVRITCCSQEIVIDDRTNLEVHGPVSMYFNEFGEVEISCFTCGSLACKATLKSVEFLRNQIDDLRNCVEELENKTKG